MISELYNHSVFIIVLSTGERPITLVLADIRFWVIHVITISSLFISGSILVMSGLSFKVFGTPSTGQYFKVSNQVPLISDRYSALSELSND